MIDSPCFPPYISLSSERKNNYTSYSHIIIIINSIFVFGFFFGEFGNTLNDLATLKSPPRQVSKRQFTRTSWEIVISLLKLSSSIELVLFLKNSEILIMIWQRCKSCKSPPRHGHGKFLRNDLHGPFGTLSMFVSLWRGIVCNILGRVSKCIKDSCSILKDEIPPPPSLPPPPI